ncbi:hypothetical protein TIFTF001_050496 [Ficus carica]|uniref:Fe2OG dioxygenase domain-containing protein n=1 Tax=Ficus carica TaxID=3494 RepID=A0AA88CRY6_FICCA|nr:hypothetical protein TIFTF001_050493 [Ficus carica]GMN27818.1 hypothetical protein TIFTF001_050494 [Ficus carica]GMN27829.1 hypothetical protein TIFTF001_050495 [Ficus carica]GMN27840.1 hypothetical protein TIFTF001_050496 [Ficus carica]
MGGIEKDESQRSKVVDQVRRACGEWGFFQVVNHGIEETVLLRMIDGGDNTGILRQSTCSRVYSVQIDLRSTRAKPQPPRRHGLCRGTCFVRPLLPAMPRTRLAIGSSNHTDSSFFTVLLQDQLGGLQVLHQDRYWVDVTPIPGALVINLGDLLQASL